MTDWPCLIIVFIRDFDNRNNEPYTYLKLPDEEPWATISLTSKTGIDMSCLVLGGPFHLQTEDICDSRG